MSETLHILALAWNPAIGLPEATALAICFVVIALWLSWMGAPGLRSPARLPMLGLRAAGLVLLAILWLNPGRWLDESAGAQREWWVLLDRSASMKSEHAAGVSRWQAGSRLAADLRKSADAAKSIHIRTFSTQLESETDDLAKVSPDATGTNIGRAVGSALDEHAAHLAGLVVISDGRETAHSDLASLALRARGRGVPIHVAPLGLNWGSRDLALSALPRQVTAFRGQPVKITAVLESHGLGAIKPAVTLADPAGKEIARQEIEMAGDARKTLVFELPTPPDSGGDYTLRTASWPGEHVLTNNADTVRVNILNTKTRVLLLEGSPYWDSKFLAQLLRQQTSIDILTVHRLNEERYFRVQASGAEPLQSPDSVFPADAAELSRYDLIVFGKGADGFLTPARARALQGFVRDQGGAVLFARGKPYSGRFDLLDALEPVEWGESQSGGYRFAPLPDEGANLFGASLPAADDRIWATLRPLEDAHAVARLKPFSRVLAEGVADGKQTRIPLLVVRRFGRGAVAAVNADGLWRWDFGPEAPGQGEVYHQFWVQLMQWCAAYSEFRPGEDYAVRLHEPFTEPGKPVRAIINYRGAASPEPKPSLRITHPGSPDQDAAATPTANSDGNEWAAMIPAPEPGRYEIRVLDSARPGREEGAVTLTVLAPPGELDDLRPDRTTLETLARESGGQVFSADDSQKIAALLNASHENATHDKPRFVPAWPKWWVALLAGLFFGGEWWLRRREGLL